MKLLIKIAGQTVDVSPDTAINLVRKSPVFQRDEIIGDYAEEINLPFTLQNDKILGYFRHPQSATAIQRMYCEQYVNTNMLTRGYVLPMEAIDNYRLAYTSGLADAFGNIRTKSLRSIDFGSIALPTNYNNTLTNTYQNGGFVFPCIWSPEFYQNPPEGFNGKINDYNNGYTRPKVPMFFVRYILEQIASLTGFVFSFDTPEINNWIIYNTQSLDSLGTILPQNHLPDLTVGQFLLGLPSSPIQHCSLMYLIVPSSSKLEKVFINLNVLWTGAKRQVPSKAKFRLDHLVWSYFLPKIRTMGHKTYAS
jgi:hypothetical protein